MERKELIAQLNQEIRDLCNELTIACDTGRKICKTVSKFDMEELEELVENDEVDNDLFPLLNILDELWF